MAGKGSSMQDPYGDRQSLHQVRQVRRFYIHATVYVWVNALLALINLVTSRGRIWFFWPLLGWGIGLAAHWFTVFVLARFRGPGWEARRK
jgi:hypothetical protein